MKQTFSMIQECTDDYSVKADNSHVDIQIKIPKKYRSLWLIKLSELRTSEAEIRELEIPNETSRQNPNG